MAHSGLGGDSTWINVKTSLSLSLSLSSIDSVSDVDNPSGFQILTNISVLRGVYNSISLPTLREGRYCYCLLVSRLTSHQTGGEIFSFIKIIQSPQPSGVTWTSRLCFLL